MSYSVLQTENDTKLFERFFEYSMSMQSVRLGESVGVKCRIQLCRLRIEPNQIYIFGGQLIVRQCSFSVWNIVQWRTIFNFRKRNCELILKCEGLGFVYIHRLWPFFLEIGLCSLLSRNCLMYTISFNSLDCISSVSSSSFLPFLHTAPCICHTAHFTLHTTHCTLHIWHCTLFTAHCTLYTPHCTLQTTVSLSFLIPRCYFPLMM